MSFCSSKLFLECGSMNSSVSYGCGFVWIIQRLITRRKKHCCAESCSHHNLHLLVHPETEVPLIQDDDDDDVGVIWRYAGAGVRSLKEPDCSLMEVKKMKMFSVQRLLCQLNKEHAFFLPWTQCSHTSAGWGCSICHLYTSVHWV